MLGFLYFEYDGVSVRSVEVTVIGMCTVKPVWFTTFHAHIMSIS